MVKRRIFDDERHAQFVTFSCYRRRRLLDHDRAKKVVLAILASQLRKQQGTCAGFVVMPDHVHAIVWFPQAEQLSHFMKQWKQRTSVQLKSLFRKQLESYAACVNLAEPIWQARYYPFNLYSEKKAVEKLTYMHLNPVRAGLVRRAIDWRYSSARYFELGRSVGVPLQWVF